MLRRTLLASAVVLAGACAAPAAFAFTEGKDADYITLDKPLPGGEGKIVKIWSYDCPFCFKFDAGVDPKAVPAAEKATGLKFDMFHIETKGKYGRAGSELFAWCMLRDKAAGITDWENPDSLFKKAKDAVYKAYHRQGQRWPEGEAAFLKTGLDAIGAKPEEFMAARKTPEVQALADSWKPSYDVAKIQGIPAYVVNGKYLVMTKSIRSLQGFVDLLTELSKK
ncbi:thiol:disulfide interchange protein DsbA/DsbL [uncultured Sutterella sp.]|uniref:thiol:disulfide interchange protein DsbA/DsbL n=1 Tax=uncultured Sutterella sp. TaxID=286133 RepID=UPI0025EC9C8E|nr:thiol:disulfide interchange protein DsbA/DsbL [uncultured Sutterella sp.]